MATRRQPKPGITRRPKPARAVEPPDQQDLQRLEEALRAQPHDIDLNRAYARALMIQGQFQRALQCWYRIEEANPQDPKAARMIAKLIISQTRQNAGKPAEQEPVSTRQDPPRITSPAAPGDRIGAVYYRSHQAPPAPERRRIELTEWQKLQRAVDENPGDVERVLQLTDYYLQQERHFDVERVLKKALSIVEDDPRLRELWEQIRLARGEKKVRLADQRLAVENTPAAQNDLQQARDEYRRLVLDTCGKRCEADPQNASLKIEMARRLQEAGDLSEALAWFQRASHHPASRAIATLHMGECLQLLDRLPDAMRHYRHVLDLTRGEPSGDCRPRALYRAAALAQQMQLAEAARQYLSELRQLDSDYRESAEQLWQQCADY